MSAPVVVLLLSTVVSAAAGAVGIAVAVRERRSGAAPWAWLLPGIGGVLIAAFLLVRLAVIW